MSDTLVAAKQEYTSQLCDILAPLLYNGFKSIWKNCKDKGKNSLKSFQTKLTSVPIWNQDIIDNEYNRIVKETDCQWLDKLIEAVFLSNVKVLSTVRIGKVKTINITIPDTKKVIHQCYIEGARRLWQDPYLIDDREDIVTYTEVKRNQKRMEVTISDAIEKTISKLIPIQSILESYLNDIDDDEVLSETELPEDLDNSSDKDPLNQDQEFVSDKEESDKEESDKEENDNSNEKDPLDNLFTEEPKYSSQENSEEPNSYTDNINLNVTEGTTVEDSTNNNGFNFENGRNIRIDNSSTKEESPFFSDDDDNENE